jgi:hypothetical protein
MKLLAFFLLQGLHQKPDKKSYFCQRKVLELFSKRRFHLLLKFLHFFNSESYDEATYNSKRLYKLKPILDHLNAEFRSVCTPECDVSVGESLMMWKGRLSWKAHIPSKGASFGIKSFELCEAKSGYVWNLFIYIGHGICQLSCSNVFEGIIILVLISESVKHNDLQPMFGRTVQFIRPYQPWACNKKLCLSMKHPQSCNKPS